jgi:hypothetical protein
MDSACSKKVAYSSQHTDDTKYGHELNFTSGGRYQQTMSAHKYLDFKFFSKKVGYDILLPFHFLPCAEGDEFEDRLICKKNSLIALELLKDTLKTLDKPFGMYRLGVTLHVYADTWSHHNFVGLLKKQNEISNLTYINEDVGLLKNFIAPLVPPISHGQALEAPDTSYLQWKYSGHKSNEQIENNNTEKFIDAAYHIYSYLTEEVYPVIPNLFPNKPKKWEQIKSKLDRMLSYKGSIDDCQQKWHEEIKNNYFGFSSNVYYDDREWFREAVEVTQIDFFELYDKKPYFEISNWKYFHDALAYHSFYIKHELLPQYGIFT